jgi:hypothetical protein
MEQEAREPGNIASAAHDTRRGRSFLLWTPKTQTMALAGPEIRGKSAS